MTTLWEKRIKGPVLDAILLGVVIYTGEGELHPGDSIGAIHCGPDSTADLPRWYIPLVAPNDPEARLSFLCLIHKSRSRTRIGDLVEPDLIENPFGHPLIVPLRESLEDSQIDIAFTKKCLTEILTRPTRIVALGRSRLAYTMAGPSVSEPLLLEVYNAEGTKLLWKNPWLTLEEGIEAASNSKIYTPSIKSAEKGGTQLGARRASVVGSSMGYAEAVGRCRGDLLELFGTQWIPGNTEIAAKEAGRLLDALGKTLSSQPGTSHKAPPRLDIPMLINLLEMAEPLGLGGESLVDTVLAEAFGEILKRGTDVVDPSLIGRSNVSIWANLDDEQLFQPSKNPDYQAGDSRASEDKERFLDLLGENYERFEKAPSNSYGREDHRSGISRDCLDADQVVFEIRNHGATYYLDGIRKALEGGCAMSAGALRTSVGIPSGSVADWKGVSDAFLRNVLQPLEKQRILVKVGDTPRNAKYCLRNYRADPTPSEVL